MNEEICTYVNLQPFKKLKCDKYLQTRQSTFGVISLQSDFCLLLLMIMSTHFLIYLEKSVTMTVWLRAFILYQCNIKTKSCPVLQTKWGQTSNFHCKIIKSIPTRCDCTMYGKSMMDRKTKMQHWIGLGPRKAHLWNLFINCEVKASEISKASVSVVHFFSKDLWF